MGKKEFKEKEYLKKRGVECPFCGKGDLNTEDPIETDGSDAWQHVNCEYCGSEWKDIYTLTGAEEVNNNT